MQKRRWILIPGFSVSAWHIVSKITDREYEDVCRS
jgi:hypothetical protein